MIQLRKLHLLIGFILVPFLFIQAVTGFAQVLGMFPSQRIQQAKRKAKAKAAAGVAAAAPKPPPAARV